MPFRFAALQFLALVYALVARVAPGMFFLPMQLTDEINRLFEDMFDLTDYENQHSLNATYGGKYAEYIERGDRHARAVRGLVNACSFSEWTGMYRLNRSVSKTGV